MRRLGLTVTWLALGCAAAPSGAQGPRVAGCYRLELGGDEADRARWGVPPRIWLDTARLTAWPTLVERYDSVFVASTITAAGDVLDHPFGYWRFAAGDSVFVGHPGALAGVSLTLHTGEAPLAGVARSFTDIAVGRPPQASTLPVLAYRVECPDVD